MNRLSSAVAAAMATLLAACASAPPSGTTAAASPPAAASASCEQLGAQIAQAEAARRAAEEQGRNAWKAVVPFVAAARYANGRAAADEAEDTIAALREQARRRGCAGAAG